MVYNIHCIYSILEYDSLPQTVLWYERFYASFTLKSIQEKTNFEKLFFKVKREDEHVQ